MKKDTRPSQAQRPASPIRVEGEPDLSSGTPAEWQAYRRTLTALPQNDENVRIAIAVADAQIARLR